MLSTMREGVLQDPPAQQIHDAGQQERRVHGAVLPVLQVAHLEAPVLRIQPPAHMHAPPQHAALWHLAHPLCPKLLPGPPSLAILALNTNCETPTAMAVCCPPGCLTVPQPRVAHNIAMGLLHVSTYSSNERGERLASPTSAFSRTLPNCAIAWLSIPVGLVASPQLCSDAHRGEQHHQQRLQGQRLPAPCQRVPRHPPPRLRQLLLCPLPALDCTCSMHCRADRGIPRKAMYHCRVQDDAGVLISHNTGILDARMPMPNAH